MASLKLKTGTPVEVKKGFVDLNGPCVVLYETVKGNLVEEHMVLAYHLLPGEIVRRAGDGDYAVEY
jgi:hypothetical protein